MEEEPPLGHIVLDPLRDHHFPHVLGEVEDQFKLLRIGIDAVEMINIQFELVTVLHDLPTTLLERLLHMIARGWCNFVRQHEAHRLSPARAAGVTDKLWSMGDLAEMIDASLPGPGKREPTKKQPEQISN